MSFEGTNRYLKKESVHKLRATELCNKQCDSHEPDKIPQDSKQALASGLDSHGCKQKQDKAGIKKLIQDFEAMKHTRFVKRSAPIETHVNIKAILKSFEGMHLNGTIKHKPEMHGCCI